MHASSNPATDHHYADLVCVARVHDYLRGGNHNFSFDRDYADAHPDAAQVVRKILSREQEFLNRAVQFMLDQGITQFLNLGSGLPARGTVLDTVVRLYPEAQVVHVDTDPAVVEHGRLIAGERTHFLQADATCLSQVLIPPITAGTLKLHKPIGVLAVGLAHLLPESERALTFLPSYGETLAHGSALAATHLTPWFGGRFTPAAAQLIAGPCGSLHPRRRRKVAQLFTGFELVAPGLIADTSMLTGLALKPSKSDTERRLRE
ncbi:S-adenosyl methyltransferase [Lentzea waywayandensis]|uniref:S-adenosyl methyltransferase n=1 Tax=Lentzea waywayandensis TaxID=84724 RepID=A0A1I6FJ04_9PSEU|nr:SAM-dependent methyltransferase [Lentzea waywayandensis]SFR29933.1 S-adenosyl methyltransferase [Lentzea waywayandensis]